MIRIGSRGSKLALWQANWVKEKLEKRFPDAEVSIKIIKTTGDRLQQETEVSQSIPKGLFTKEIQDAVLRNEVDIAVHSLKDLPTDTHEGLTLVSITKREDPHDAVVCRSSTTKLADLPQAARVGTSSTRRRSQLLNLRPDLQIEEVRGNVDTRLRKLDEGEFDCLLLAAAGLIRLGLKDRISELLSPEVMVPAVGQGALAIETRSDDKETQRYIRTLNHKATHICCYAERVFLEALGGGCQVPIAAHAQIEKERLMLRGCVASLDGKIVVKRAISGTVEEAEFLGNKLAEKILAAGADKLLKEIKTLGRSNTPSKIG
ncbi:MAG: hydroxymethylbilane synthase [Blastocatellia bacterium]|nr:hydroxymethylbilane synthase [Blastocatellia bacterium]